MFLSPWARLAVLTTMVLAGVVLYSMVTGRLERAGSEGRRRSRALLVVGSTVAGIAILSKPLGLGSGDGGFGVLQGSGVAIGAVLVLGRHALAGASLGHIAAVVVWVLATWVSVLVLPTEASAVQPISAGVGRDRSVIDVTVPHQGGCASQSLDVQHRWRGDTLVLWLSRPEESFMCLAACLDEPCTETVRLVLDQPMPPGTSVDFGEGAGFNLRTTAAVVITLAGFVVGLRLWSTANAAAPGYRAGTTTERASDAG